MLIGRCQLDGSLVLGTGLLAGLFLLSPSAATMSSWGALWMAGPGAVLAHELCHAAVCVWYGVEIQSVRIGFTWGELLHERPARRVHARILIAGPAGHVLYGLAMHLTGRICAVRGLEGGQLALLGLLVSAHAMTNLWPRGGSDGAQLLALYRAAPKDRRRPPVQRL
jgi:hypothetical protein